MSGESYIVWVAGIIYAAVWLALLVHCLLRRRFYPLLGPGLPTRMMWVVTFLLFNPLLTGVYLIFGVLAPPRDRARPAIRGLAFAAIALSVIAWHHWNAPTPADVITWIRDEQTGQMVAQGESSGGLELRAGQLMSSNGSSFSSSHTSSRHSGLLCRSIAIVNFSDHALMDQLGRSLAEKLSALRFLERVSYHPAGHPLAPDEADQDVTVWLDLAAFDQTDLRVHRSVEATIRMTAANSVYPPLSGGYTDHLTPPIVRFGLWGEVEHSSRFSGYETVAARYHQLADSLSAELYGQLVKKLDALANEHHLLRDVPDALQGAYEPAPEFAFAQDPACTLVASRPGFMVHNETAWRIDRHEDPHELIRALHDALETSGWRGSVPDPDRLPFMSMSRGDERLRFSTAAQGAITGPPIDTDEANAGVMPPLYAVYRHRFDEAERHKALAAMLEAPVEIERWLMLVRMAHRAPEAVRRALRERLEQAAPHSPAAAVEWVDRLVRDGFPDQAREVFRRVLAQAYGAPDGSDLVGRLEDLAAELDQPELASEPIRLDELKAAGLTALMPGGDEVSRKLEPGQSVVAYVPMDDERFVYAHVSIDRKLDAALSTGDDPTPPRALSITACLRHPEHGQVTTSSSIHPMQPNGEMGQASCGFNGTRLAAVASRPDPAEPFAVNLTAELLDQVSPATTTPSPVPTAQP